VRFRTERRHPDDHGKEAEMVRGTHTVDDLLKDMYSYHKEYEVYSGPDGEKDRREILEPEFKAAGVRGMATGTQFTPAQLMPLLGGKNLDAATLDEFLGIQIGDLYKSVDDVGPQEFEFSFVTPRSFWEMTSRRIRREKMLVRLV